MKEKKSLDQIANQIAKEILTATVKEEQERLDKQNEIRIAKENQGTFFNTLQQENKETYNQYLSIHDQLVQDKSLKDTAPLKKCIEQLDKLIEIKKETPYKENHELAYHLLPLRISLAEYQLSIERNETFNSLNNNHTLNTENTFLSFNKTVLKKRQLVFLMDTLRKNKVFMSDVSDTDMAKAFATLTGTSGEQLRKGFSEKLEFTEEDKSTIKSILDNIGKAVDEVPTKYK